jgi:hypothetical protein
MTTALAEQMVITLKAQPPAYLAKQLEAELQKLDAISLLGGKGTPAAVAAAVAAVESQIETELRNSGLVADTTTTQVQASATPFPTNTATHGSFPGASASPSAGNSPASMLSASEQPSPSSSPTPSETPAPTPSR